MRFRPFQITYEAEEGKTVVLLHGRDEEGNRRTIRVDGTEPHFFVKPGAADNLKSEMVTRIEKKSAKDFITGEKLDKVVTRFPFEVPKIRDDCGKTWEADVLYENRVRYDLGIKADIDVPAGTERLHRTQVRPYRGLRPGVAGVRPNGPLKPIAPRLAVYDIETFDKGGFHGPDDPRAPVVAIAAWDSHSDRYVCIFNGVLRQSHRDSLVRRFLKPHKGVKAWDVQVVEVATEEAIFEAFNGWLHAVQPDLLIGWNSSEYDDDYLKNRAQRIGAQEPDFDPLVLFDAEDGYIFSKYQRPESSALHYIATEYFKLPGKSTDQRIWQMLEGDRADLVFYNVNDVFLTKEIVLQSGIMDFYLRLAERAGTGLGRCFSTGHLVDSMVFHHLAGSGLAQPTKIKRTKKEIEEWGKIKGAEVFDPASGLFENVVELDNGGEYPELIRTFNLSPETIIEPAKWEEFERQAIPFIQTPNGNRYRLDKKGVFPILLTELIQDRAIAKKAGDKIGDDVNKKLSNTFYGVMPSPTYRMPDRRIGGDITGLAREHLKWNKDFAQGWTNPAHVLYGDSVTGNMPVVIRNNKTGLLDVREIQDLGGDWQDLSVLSDRGFTPIVRWIKKPRRKRIFAVRTLEGFVQVTEDHSLLSSEGKEIPPLNSEGQDLLSCSLEISGKNKSDLNFDKAWLLGAFAADGYCRTDFESYNQTCFSINKNNLDFLAHCARILRDEWGYETRVKDIRKSTGCQRLYLNSTKDSGISTKEAVRKFRAMCYTSTGLKKVPVEVLNGSDEVKHGFLEGFYAGDGDKEYKGTKLYTRTESKSPVFHQGIAVLHNSLGDSCSVNFRANKKSDGRILYYTRLTHRSRAEHGRTVNNRVIKVQEIQVPDEWVYDLETENHHFACGVGNLVVHNTDSNHLVFKTKPDRETAVKWGKELASSMNGSFLSFARQFGPVDVCTLNVKMEHLYDKFLQAGTKKKYACLYRDPEKGDVERDGIKYTIKWRGFEIRRGDAAEATKKAQTSVLTEMLFGATRGETIERVNALVKKWRSCPTEDPASLWMLGKPKIVNKQKQIDEAVRYSNAYLGTQYRKGDKPALYFGYVSGNPKVEAFMYDWRQPLPPGTNLNMEVTIDATILTPLEGPLDLLDLRPSDCKNPVESVADWI